MLRQFCFVNDLLKHIRENTDFPQQKSQQLLSAEANFEGCAIYIIRHIQDSGIFRTLNAGICKHIKAYSAFLRHIHTYWGFIEAYTSLFKHIQHPVQPLHICATLAIFPVLAYLGLETYSKPCETFTRHMQNPAIVRTVYSGIIQSYSDIFRTFCNACKCKNLVYLESWNIQNPSIIVSWDIFITLSYLQK